MRSGFSLIELLVVIAILGILASIGVAGYNGYINQTRKEAALRNMEKINRAFNQDYIALTNDIGGPSEIANQDGAVVTRSDQCIQYVTKVVKNMNNISNLKNSYDSTLPYAVNLHDNRDKIVGGTAHDFLHPGQLGIQCANTNAIVTDKTNFYIHRCTCTGTNNCDLHTFESADVIGGDNCDSTSGTLNERIACRYHLNTQNFPPNLRWRTNGTIKLGQHIPNWVCPKADFVDVNSP